MMKEFLRLSVIVSSAVALGLSTSHASEGGLAEYIEPDAQVVVSIRDIGETLEDWKAHPIAKIIEDEGLQELFAALSEDEVDNTDDRDAFSGFLEDEFDLTKDAFFEMFNGSVSFTLYDLSGIFLELTKEPEALLIAEFSGDPEQVDEFMRFQFERNANKQKAINPLMEHVLIEESFMGEVLYLDETFDGEETYFENGYALVDDYFLFGHDKRLRNTIELIKEGGDSLAQSDIYARAMEQSSRGDLRVYCNVSALVAPLNEALLKKPNLGFLTTFGVTGQSLMDALSLASMEGYFMDLELVEDAVRMHGGLLYTEKKGILQLLTYRDENLPEASYVPTGVLASSISTFDMSAMLKELEQVLAVASPTVPMLFDLQLQLMKTNTGIDLRTSLLENLNGDFVSLSALRESGMGADFPLSEQLYVIDVQDSETLSQALEAFKDLVPGMRDMLQTQEYEGETIHTIKATPNPQQPDTPLNDVSYVITRSKFIVNVGGLGLLHDVLKRMASSDRGFWQMEETEQMFDRVADANPVARSYVDLEQMVKPVLQSLLQATNMSGVGPKVDPSKIPTSLNAPWSVVSESNESEDGIFTRVMLIQREDDE
ncbi:MAG: hypothetical protein ACSHX8_03385 [Opitutaceae bacterium]